LPLRIAITAGLSGGKLHLTVENSGHWIQPDPARPFGIGITNLRKRLQLLYGDEAQLSFEHTEARVKAEVSIPIQAAA
jgi:LytS/YehU family sensor histidine kinase